MGLAIGRPQVEVQGDTDISLGCGNEHALYSLANYLTGDMRECNKTILTRMQSPVPMISKLAGYLVAAGGKRLRPLLTLASARLCGYGDKKNQRRHIHLAACVEFIHTATLLHDDVVDGSILRRGLASANTIFGNKASVLVGDFLFARAFQLITEDGSTKIMKILSDASATIAEGEVLQMSIQNNLSTSIDQYLRVIYSKTAALFAAACHVGAVVADSKDDHEHAIMSYGLNLGMAFQLIDDVLDYSADQKLLGKTVGDDFREGKVTFPVIIAYGMGDEKERDFWNRVIHEGDKKESDLSHAMELMFNKGALGETVKRAEHYVFLARNALELFSDGALKAILTDVADYATERLR